MRFGSDFGECPTGFVCRNGKKITVTWRDTENNGQCYSPDTPNFGIAQGRIEETEAANTVFIGPPSQRDTGIRATDPDGNPVPFSSFEIYEQTCDDENSNVDVSGSWKIIQGESQNIGKIATNKAVLYDTCKVHKRRYELLLGQRKQNVWDDKHKKHE